MPELLVEDDGPVRVLRLNRPEKRNALNNTLTAALVEALHEADRRDATRAVVLCGAGPSFCAGADLAEFAGLRSDHGDEAARARAELTASLHALFPRIAKPIVGAVQGHALGGGAGLALACDVLVLAESAKLGYPELKRGVVAAIVTANLVRQVGPKTAFELVALAEPFGAARALGLGLANRVVPDSELLAEAMRLASALAQHPPHAMAATKRLFYKAVDLSLDEALAAGRDANVVMRGYADPKAG